MKKILIIGISSFSGASLANYLQDKYIIYGTFNKYIKTTNCIFDKKKINLFKVDFTKDKDITKLSKKILSIKPSIIVDFASICMVEESWTFQEKYFQINVNSRIKLLKKIKNPKFIKKYIYISTPEIFGSSSKPINEFSYRFNPSTPYANSKLAAEFVFKNLNKLNGFPIIISRFSNFYGPGQPEYRLIPKVYYSIKSNRKFPLHGNGSSKRNFLYSKDFCSGIHKIIKKGKVSKTYHFSGTKFIKISEVIKLICKKYNFNFKKLIEFTTDRQNKDKIYILDCNWTKKQLDWKEKYDYKNGILNTLKFYEKKKNFNTQLNYKMY